MTQAIIQWNCRGLRANFEELNILFSSFSPAVVCLQETLQHDDKMIKFRHYMQYYKNSLKMDGRPNGGVSILIKNNFPHSQINLTTNFQAVATRVTLHRVITICCIYLPPNSPVDTLDLVNLINQLPAPILFVGDFNAHSPLWGCSSLDNRGKICEDLINNQTLCILNNKTPTYLHPATGSRTSIDLSICDPSLMLDLSWTVHDDLCGSDHFPIIIQNNKPVPQATISKWKLNKADWTLFHDLSEHQLNCTDTLSTKFNIDIFTAKLIDIANKSIPKTSPNPKQNKKPWFNEDCKTAINSRKQSLKLFTLQPTSCNLDNFRICRAKCRRTLREAKRSSWQSYVSGLTSRTTVKKTWDMIRKISGKISQNPIKHLSNNGVLVTSLKDITDTFGKTIAYNSSTNHYTTKFQKFKYTQERQHINFKSNNLENYNMLFSLDELTDALRRAHDSSPGPDEVHYQFIKHLPQTTLELLLNTYNKIWTTGDFPNSWQQALLIPIPKPDKDLQDPNNYRPIALTSCLCKLMERMVNNRLVYYLESNNLISNIQSGFREQRSTTDQLVRLETWIREGLANRDHVVAIFFDLEKAYDTTWKHGILLDLFQAGLRGHLPTFISKFLENRFFRVRIGSTLSDQYYQETGVPQGSILSVTLFNLKINSITHCVRDGTESSLYVDDFLACVRSQQMRSIERQLQLCLNNLQKWSDENGFKFSKSKTVCMHFCTKRHLHPDPVLLLDNHPIPVVVETKFLGVIFDRKLSFIPHLQHLRTKCFKALNLLKVVSHRDWGGDTETLLKLYRSLIRSKLDYGCIVYGSARKSYIQMLDPIQNQALRLCLGAFRTSPIESLQVEANEPTLATRRNKLALQYAIKLKSNLNNPTYDCIFNPHYTALFESRPNTIPPLSTRIENILAEINLNFNVIEPHNFPSLEPWTLKLPKVVFELHSEKKSTTHPDLLRSQFYCFISNKLGYTHIYTDGSKYQNGVAAAAVGMNQTITRRLSSHASIFSAEAIALTLALEIVEAAGDRNFWIFSDSLSCLQAIKFRQLQNPLILNILQKCHMLMVTHDKIVQFCWIPSHVGISGNEKADLAAKGAIQLPINTDIKLPYTDLKQDINQYYTKSWQTIWNNTLFNKLQNVKPALGKTKLYNLTTRRDEVVLHRLRIGHTYLTHSYLLKQDNNPDCSTCKCLLTVQHILLECPNYNFIRVKYFQATSLYDLFNKVPLVHIINYLKEIKLYKNI